MSRLAPEGTVYQAGTLSGNPIATASGLATLRALDADVYQSVDVGAEQIGNAVSEVLTGPVSHTGCNARGRCSASFSRTPMSSTTRGPRNRSRSATGRSSTRCSLPALTYHRQPSRRGSSVRHMTTTRSVRFWTHFPAAAAAAAGAKPEALRARTPSVHLMRHGEVHNPGGVLYGRLPGYQLSELVARWPTASPNICRRPTSAMSAHRRLNVPKKRPSRSRTHTA